MIRMDYCTCPAVIPAAVHDRNTHNTAFHSPHRAANISTAASTG